jgi:N-acyl-D-aspartate/D-glutamate deacylase
MHDLVIRGGKVIDGSGSAPFMADVAVDGGRIVEVGQVGPGRRELDADGLLVTPGFVDMHTHYDAQATWDPNLTPSCWHGVTTVVMGSCGVGFAPVRPGPEAQAWLIGLMEGVEDIPGAALAEGIQWGWESFPEYLDTLASQPHALDFGTQVPHGALRAYVMGERGARNEEATAEDVVTMANLVEQALRAGALGFSTSRTLLHRSAIDNEPVPGTYAGRDELFGIGRALARAGHGVFQLAADHARVPEELQWVEELAQETGRTVMFNLSQFDQAPGLWRESVEILDRAQAQGLPIYAQVAGRAIGIMMTLRGTAHPFVPYPSYQAIAGKPWAEQLAALQDPTFRERLLNEEPVSIGPFEDFIAGTFGRMFVVEGSNDYEPDPAKASVAALAAATGKRPVGIALDALMRDDGEGMLYFPLFNYADGNLELLHELHQHPHTRMGLSDAGAHCGAICDGGVPTFMLTHWGRDRTRGPVLPLPHLIHRQTRQTALAFGLEDRGLVAPGFKADLNLIDFGRLSLGAPRLVHDLPAGGRRLLQRASGYRATIVSGEVILEHDELTGNLPGKLLRGPQRVPAGVSA